MTTDFCIGDACPVCETHKSGGRPGAVTACTDADPREPSGDGGDLPVLVTPTSPRGVDQPPRREGSTTQQEEDR